MLLVPERRESPRGMEIESLIHRRRDYAGCGWF